MSGVRVQVYRGEEWANVNDIEEWFDELIEHADKIGHDPFVIGLLQSLRTDVQLMREKKVTA